MDKFKLKWCFLVLGTVCISLCSSNPTCSDFLMGDVCKAYYDFGQCYLHQARINCRKTCKVCGDGWTTWSSWSLCSSLCDGVQTRTRQCLSSASHCPGEDLESQTCDRVGARCDGSETSGTDSPEPFIPDELQKYVCDDLRFRCTASSAICISNDLICDGHNDCPNSFDENFSSCSLAANSNSTFQIKNELMQTCFEVITDDPLGPIDGVRSYRRCASGFSPQRNKFLWRWWKGYSLLNLHTGKCLTANDPRRSTLEQIRVETCNDAMPTQHWMCHGGNESTFLVRPRELTMDDIPRFVNLGEDNLGWPLVFSTNATSLKSFWQKGPKEPPESICSDLQVHWSYWSSWMECSLTCGNGRRSRSKICVNGVAGVAPCLGSYNEVSPCNTGISCRKSPGLHHNSQCRDDFEMMDNERKTTSRNILDPSCYRIFGIESPETFEEARKSCIKHRSTLGSIKTKESQEFVKTLLSNTALESDFYIGVEESFTSLPVLNHQFLFLFDNLTIGSFAPWKEDCITGLGSDYRGKRSVAYDLKTGKSLKCQSWKVNTPHVIRYTPLPEGDLTNYCRNPNLDPLGPWCYSLDPNVEIAYCNIPQCAEHLAPYKLNEELFQIRRIKNTILYYTSQPESDVGDALCVTAEGVRRFDQLGEPAEIWLKLKACEKIVESVIDENQRFIWDISRRRILHDKSMLCMSATSEQVNSGVVLETCSAEKATQRWRVDGKFIILDVFHSDEVLHLDIGSTGDDLVITNLDLRGWTSTISGGFVTDWLGLRKAYRDESFELYHTSAEKCLAAGIEEKYKDIATLHVGIEAKLIMLPCASSPQFQWMRHPTSPNLLLHIQTSLCLFADAPESGAAVALKICDVMDKLQWWSCSGYANQNIALQAHPDLVLFQEGDENVIVSSVKHNATWIGWGSRNRTACQFKVARGDSIRGQEFAIKHQQSEKCLKHDQFGSLFLERCSERGDPSDEEWSFTESPTMIRNVVSGKCIRAQAGTSGSSVMTYTCRSQDVMQHWTLYRLSTVQALENQITFYSLHLVANPELAVTVDGVSGRLMLQENTEITWEAVGQNGKPTSLIQKSDCAVYANGVIYYSGSRAVSKSGRRCVPWSETRLGQIFPELESNYCRNPGRKSFRPWCFVMSAKGIPLTEQCGIPVCSPVKVKVDPNGKWIASTGNEKLPYLCQAESECYRGIGTDYIGSWNSTKSGYCAAWKDHKESGFESNYCRNPNSIETGPWCYIYRTRTTKVTCPIPKCHPTCLNTPSNVYHGDLLKFEYSASSFGAEEKTLAVKRCHKGYWIKSDVYISQTLCDRGIWKPELDACKVVICSAMNVTVKGAIFSSSSAVLYNQHSYFTCQPGLLAGPGQAKISYRCNELGQWENDELGADSCLPGCDEDWIPFRGHCYRTYNAKLNYSDAREYCKNLDGTLPDIDDEVTFEFLMEQVKPGGVSDPATYWLGIEHHWDDDSSSITDRNFKSINHGSRETLSKGGGVGYLPLIHDSFKILHSIAVSMAPDIAKSIPYDKRCMFGYDHSDYVVSRGCDDYTERRLLWTWISPFHLLHIGTKKCLTGSAMNGNPKSGPDFYEATLEDCSRDNQNQYITCKRGGEASLKLMYQTESYFVDDLESQLWDKVIVGNKHYHPNASYWTTDKPGHDPCHWTLRRKGNVFLIWEGTQASGTSYTYEQAEEMCKDLGGRLASKTEVDESMQEEDLSACSCTWIDGKKQVTAQKQVTEGCGSVTGVRLCTNQAKADAFCFRGEKRDALDEKLALVLSSLSFVKEVSSEEMHNVICRKESRWHCPHPTPIPRAIIEEATSTSYSYLGFTTYTCQPGYWFSRGVYSKVVRCNYKLQWDPDPASLSCEPLYCSQPPEIINSNLVVHSLNIFGTAEYKCHFGYQFSWALFKLTVTCKESGQWEPTPSWQQCKAVTCKTPPEVDHADSVIFSLSYPYNTTYTCHDGYWMGPGVYETNVMCNGDGYWKPNPEDILCFEIVCIAFNAPQNMILERQSVKKLLMRCEEDYYLLYKRQPAGRNVTLTCQNDAEWLPNPEDYSCTIKTCGRPGDVQGTEHTAISGLTSFRIGEKVDYSCDVGTRMLRTFTPYNPLHRVCFFKGDDDVIYTSKQSCGTVDALTLRWYNDSMIYDVESRRCLATIEIATRVDYKQNLVLKTCDESDLSQRWHCGKQGPGTLHLGSNASLDVFVATRDFNGKAFVTHDKEEWLEWIDYHEKDSGVEYELCKYKILEMKQIVTCSSAEYWIPDPKKAIDCVPLQCSPPPELKHSTYAILGDGLLSENIPYATAVRYTCEEGYAHFRGRNSSVSRCTEQGHWAPDPKTLPCLPILCPKYRPPTESMITEGSIDDDYQFPKEIHVRCPDGMMFRPGIYNLIAKCGANGEWQSTIPATACEEVHCPFLPEVKNTIVDKIGDKLTYRTVARYACSEGYWYSPGLNWKETFCEKSGFWEPNPTDFLCIEKACREPEPIPFSLRDGDEPDKESGHYQYGAMIYIKCEKGREFDDGIRKIVITCKQDAMWHPNPSYLKCVELECPLPSPLPENGFLNGAHFVAGAEVTIECYDGYYISDTNGEVQTAFVITCGDLLTWEPSPSDVICEPITCGEPPNVANADLIKWGHYLGSFAQYSCNIGYWIRTAVYFFPAECNSAALWQPDPITQVCKVVTCDHPGAIDNGIVDIERNPAQYQDVAILRCHLGFWLLGYFKVSVQMECNERGTWDPSPLKLECVAVLCVDPGELPRSQRLASNYDMSLNQRNSQGVKYYPYGARMSYTCNDGYQFAWQQNEITTTCQATGEWSIDISKMVCIETTCEFTQGIVHGHVVEEYDVSESGFIANTTLKFECNKGYWFAKGEFMKTVTCMSNNRWSVDLRNLACVRVACPELPDVEYSTHTSTGTTATDKALYQCETGKEAEPQAEYECDENGRWVPDITKLNCSTAKCYVPTPIPNTQSKTSFPFENPDNPLLYGKTATVLCESGYYFLPRVQRVEIQCMGNNEISPTFVVNGCFEETFFPCETLPHIVHASPVTVETKRIVYRCDNGHEFLLADGARVRTLEFNCFHGQWTPDPSTSSCSAIMCPKPTLSTNMMFAVAPSETSYPFNTALLVQCSSNQHITYRPYAEKFLKSLPIMCGYQEKWFPDPIVDIACINKPCDAPPTIPNTSSFGSTKNMAIYSCNDQRGFNRSSSTLKSYCNPPGEWVPDPSLYRCSEFKCPMPREYKFSTVAMVTEKTDMIVRVSCFAGYWMNFSAGIPAFSGKLQCSKIGNWRKLTVIKDCEPLTCSELPDIRQAVKSEGMSFPYLHRAKYTCEKNYWFADIRKQYRFVECSLYAKWRPDPLMLQCQPVVCSMPKAIDNAYTLDGALSIGSTRMYRCFDGYQFERGVYEFETMCRYDGEWHPSPESMLACSAIVCTKPPALFNMDESSQVMLKWIDAFVEGDTFLYMCAKGYWISDGLNRHKRIEVTCNNGSWTPSLENIIGCSIVVCDIPPPVYGASLEGGNHYYNNTAMYQCARGLHFHSYKLRTLEVYCNEDAFWSPDAYTLECSDVLCDDINIPNAIRYGDKVDIDAVMIFECPAKMWLKRGQRELTTKCNEDGRWEPDVSGLACEIVSCGLPDLEHGYASGSDFSYSKKVTLKCASGYYMVPSVASPPEVTCSIDGTWYPYPESYICQPIKCMEPPFIPHATFTGDLQYNSTLQATCDAGYYFRITVNHIDMECETDGTWSEDFNNMKCVAFTCPSVPKVPSALSQVIGPIRPPNYGSQLQYTCRDGYWISRNIFSLVIRCNDTGVWDPNPDVLCTPIKCPRPLYKHNAVMYLSDGVKNVSEYDMGIKIRFECLPSYWIYARYSILDWSFTGTRSVDIVCSKLGKWQPHDFTFTCAAISTQGNPSGIPSGISTADIVRSNWRTITGIKSDDVASHPYLGLMKTGTAFWIGGSPKSKHSSIVQPTKSKEIDVNKAWDGNRTTFWTPELSSDGRYEFTISLDAVYFVDGFEVDSQVSSQVDASLVSNMELAFSKNGKMFSDKKSFLLASNRGKMSQDNAMSDLMDSLNSAISIKSGRTTIVHSNDKSVYVASGFSVPAKFIKVTITGTTIPNLPPTLQEFKLLVSPAEWVINYPIDYVTIPTMILVTFMLWIAVCITAYMLDKGCCDSVHLDEMALDFSVEKNYYVFKFDSPHIGRLRLLLCRLIQQGTVTPIVAAKLKKHWYSPYQCFYVVLTGADMEASELNVGLLAHSDVNEPMPITIQVAKISPEMSSLSALKWVTITKKVLARPGVCLSFPLKSFIENRRKEVGTKNVTSRNFIRTTSKNHTLASFCINDPFHPILKFDASIINLAALSVGLLFPVILFPYHEIFGTLLFCVSNVALMLMMTSILKCIYYKLNPNWDVVGVMERMQHAREIARDRGDNDGSQFTPTHNDMRLDSDNVLRHLVTKLLNQEVTELSYASLTSMSNYDSLLIPSEYIKKKLSQEITDPVITDELLENAAQKRMQCGVRRSNSCFALMNFHDLAEGQSDGDRQSTKFRLDPCHGDVFEQDISVKSSLESILHDAEMQEKEPFVDKLSHGLYKGKLLYKPETLKRPSLNQNRVRNIYRVPNEWLKPSAGAAFCKGIGDSDVDGSSSKVYSTASLNDIRQEKSTVLSGNASEPMLPSALLSFTNQCSEQIYSKKKQFANMTVFFLAFACVGVSVYFGLLPSNAVKMVLFYHCIVLCSFVTVVFPVDMLFSSVLLRIWFSKKLG